MSEIVIRPLRPAEIPRFVELGYYAFGGRSPERRRADFGRRLDPERQVLVAVDGDEIVSQVAIYQFDVWIDSVRYPCGGLANVATVPERSRQGLASQLLRAALGWMKDELGLCLSTLYPTVSPLYEHLGWALTAQGRQYSGPPSAFRPSRHLPLDSEGTIERRLARLEDVDLLQPLYQQFALPRSGYLDRPRWYWEDTVLTVVDPQTREARRRWLGLWRGSDDEYTGYVVYGPSAQGAGQTTVYELVSLVPEGYRGLLTFLSAHHLWTSITVNAGGDVPWLSLVSDPQQLNAEIPFASQFMVRIIDFARAVSRRAVASGTSAKPVVLRVHDSEAPWNDGPWQLRLSRDRWSCERVEPANSDAEADISTVGLLFTGALTVRDAMEIGVLRAAHTAVPSIETFFATPYPAYSGDHF